MRESLQDPEKRAPLLIEASDRTTLTELLTAHALEFRAKLLIHGALLFRGFGITDVESFDSVIAAWSPERLSYTFRSTPRTAVADRVYTATEYPAKYSIPLHNENAYARQWPLTLLFGCLVPALTGGMTPLADMREVTRAIGPDIVQEFAARRVMYVRHYHPDADLPWQTVFQTQDPEVVARFCEQHGIRHQWLGKERLLSTTQICQGVAQHPHTAERVFFNQAHLFHVSSLGEATAGAMIDVFGQDRLPRHARFGDGAEIPAATLAAVRAGFEAASIRFPWQAGDVLCLDNMQMAHGRMPFTGPRKVLAALLESYSSSES